MSQPFFPRNVKALGHQHTRIVAQFYISVNITVKIKCIAQPYLYVISWTTFHFYYLLNSVNLFMTVPAIELHLHSQTSFSDLTRLSIDTPFSSVMSRYAANKAVKLIGSFNSGSLIQKQLLRITVIGKGMCSSFLMCTFVVAQLDPTCFFFYTPYH